MFYLLRKGNQMSISHARCLDVRKITDLRPCHFWHPLYRFCIIWYWTGQTTAKGCSTHSLQTSFDTTVSFSTLRLKIVLWRHARDLVRVKKELPWQCGAGRAARTRDVSSPLSNCTQVVVYCDVTISNYG